MIISAHLGDCILIASDKRAMTCDLETGAMRLSHDDEQKIKIWCRGAFTGSGDTVFLDRVAKYFIDIQENDSQLKQMNVIYAEIEKRVLEGVPKKILLNNVIIFSMFDGSKTLLYSIPIEPFFHHIKENGMDIIQPQMHEIKEWSVDVACFNIPPDMSSLQEFQRNLKAMESFNNSEEFIEYYIQNLKQIFATHASIDPSITTAFDFYIQFCKTGEGIALHIPNLALPSNIPKNLNYWNRE